VFGVNNKQFDNSSLYLGEEAKQIIQAKQTLVTTTNKEWALKASRMFLKRNSSLSDSVPSV